MNRTFDSATPDALTPDERAPITGRRTSGANSRRDKRRQEPRARRASRVLVAAGIVVVVLVLGVVAAVALAGGSSPEPSHAASDADGAATVDSTSTTAAEDEFAADEVSVAYLPYGPITVRTGPFVAPETSSLNMRPSLDCNRDGCALEIDVGGGLSYAGAPQPDQIELADRQPIDGARWQVTRTFPSQVCTATITATWDLAASGVDQLEGREVPKGITGTITIDTTAGFEPDGLKCHDAGQMVIDVDATLAGGQAVTPSNGVDTGEDATTEG